MVMMSEEETDRIRIRIGQSVGEAVRRIIKEENDRQTDAIIREVGLGLRKLENNMSTLHYNLSSRFDELHERVREIEDDKVAIMERINSIEDNIHEKTIRVEKLEGHINALNTQLDEEKRKRRESDSSLGWLILLLLFLLGSSFQQKITEIQTRKELTLDEYVKAKYGL